MKSVKDLMTLLVLVVLLFVGLYAVVLGIHVLGIVCICVSVFAWAYVLVRKRERYYDYR